MMQNSFKQIAMGKLLQPQGERLYVIYKVKEAESCKEDVLEKVDVDVGFDVLDNKIEVWLKCIGLLEFAWLPWETWEKKKFAKGKLGH